MHGGDTNHYSLRLSIQLQPNGQNSSLRFPPLGISSQPSTLTRDVRSFFIPSLSHRYPHDYSPYFKPMHADAGSDIVNQKIFRQRFFPFYQFCDRDHPYYKTPTGGLIVQWFWTVLNIAIAPNSPGGYGFIINVTSYGHVALTCMYLQSSWNPCTWVPTIKHDSDERSYRM